MKRIYSAGVQDPKLTKAIGPNSIISTNSEPSLLIFLPAYRRRRARALQKGVAHGD